MHAYIFSDNIKVDFFLNCISEWKKRSLMLNTPFICVNYKEK